MVAFAEKAMPERFGPYRLIRKLGAGGMAEVFLAEDMGAKSRAPVIVKRLLPEMANYGEAIAMFLKEAELALKFAHPNVRRVHDFGRIGSRYFMTMECVVGVCLADLVSERGTPDLGRRAPGAIVRVVMDVCAALEHVHGQGVVHGDVNPRNVLVGTGGVAKLTDFGCAVAGEAARKGHEVRGTHAYMSPEQVRGEAMDRRSDVFSTGVMLWELIACKRLFKRTERHLTMFAVVEHPAPPLEAPALDRAVQRALAKQPADRYASAAALAADLAAAAGELGLDASAEAVAGVVRACTGRRRG
jgi:serine/threonine protein kinase